MTEYRIRDDERGLIGPVQLEALCDLLESESIKKNAQVSKNDGPFEPLQSFSEIASFLESLSPTKPTITGTLGPRTIVPVLHQIHTDQDTGLLKVKDGALRKDVYACKGQLMYLSSSISSERLGHFLVMRKVIGQKDLEVALRYSRQRQRRLGETLVQLGILEPDDLFHELRRHQIERLMELCCWRTGSYEYFQGRAFPGDEPGLQTAIPKLIMTVVRQMPEDMLLPYLETFMSHAPAHIDNNIVTTLGFNDAERKILEMLDGTQTLEQVMQGIGPLGIENVFALRVFHVLVETNALEF